MYTFYLYIAPQVAPRNFKLTAVSPYCVSLSYDPVLYPNGPESGLVYQVKQQWTFSLMTYNILNEDLKRKTTFVHFQKKWDFSSLG